jgi:glycosyltransferase involved in cell wall biosynthesis
MKFCQNRNDSKILIDGIAYRLKKTGGVRRYFDGLLLNLKKLDNKNINIKLLLPKKIPTPFPKRIFEPLMGPINQIILQKQWKNIKGDIFHTTYYTQHPDKHIPQVVTVYDMIYEKFPQYFLGQKNQFFKRQKKKAIQSADAVICISQNTKKDVIKHLGVDKNKITVIYPGVNPIFRKISNKKIKNKFLHKYKIKKPYLLFIGPRGRYKNFNNLLQAYADWRVNSKINLVVVGGGKFTNKEKDLIAKLNLVNKVFVFSFVSDEDLCFFYNAAHAFIFPSLYEGFGFPLLEAMTCGSLCLASDRGSFPEIGQDSILYFNPKNVDSIVKSLNDSFDKNRRSQLIKKSLKRAKDFSFKKTAKQTLEVYKRLHHS